MSPWITASLVALNLGVIFLLLAAPLGVRVVSVSRLIQAPRERLWSALWPLGADAGWSGEILSAEREGSNPFTARLRLSWEGRDTLPIERIVALEDVEQGERFGMRVLDDSSLDPSFWANYREETRLSRERGAVRVTLRREDHYRGLAFLIFRYFALRRQIAKLDAWALTGKYRSGGVFEHPLTQVGFAFVSVLILWPLLGLTAGGFAVAAILTAAVGLHELGHLAAFRLMGHRRVRMIFIPLLGGIAIGGRPYDSHFEVAFVALMGAGFSAFLVVIAMATSGYASAVGMTMLGSLLATFAGCSALFNLANLVPVWKFDGGQVLRQICPNPAVLAIASFALLGAFLALGHVVGFSPGVLVAGGASFVILSILTAGSGVKPRRALKPISAVDRLAIAAALVAVFAIHCCGIFWAAAKLV